jgi:peptidoglycan/LPS O-acetylase OafA/YrhL
MTAPFAWRALQRRPDVWVARTVSALGIGFAVAAVATVPLIPDEPFLPAVWPPVFGLAAVLCFAAIAWPESVRIYMAAGATSVLAWASRPVAVIVRAVDGQAVAPRAVLGTVTYTTLAYLIAWYWTNPVAAWRARRQIERTDVVFHAPRLGGERLALLRDGERIVHPRGG